MHSNLIITGVRFTYMRVTKIKVNKKYSFFLKFLSFVALKHEKNMSEISDNENLFNVIFKSLSISQKKTL